MNPVPSSDSERLALPSPPTPPVLSLEALDAAARQAAEDLLRAGQAQNTLISYRSALRYWSAWAQVRYGRPLALPVPAAVAVQFIVDHTARFKNGERVIELPAALDQQLVEAGFKGAPGPLKLSTVTHRLAVLSKLHQLERLPNPCEDPAVRQLLARARRAAVRAGDAPTKKTAATREPLEAMLATCDESLLGVRDRALLLFAWASGGRRRSEVAAATVEQLQRVRPDLYRYRLGHSKTNPAGTATPDKPIAGRAADALTAWLERARIVEGPLFRRVRGDTAAGALAPAAVAAIVKRRAAQAGLEGDWGGHSLRSGFVTEAGRRRIPLGDVMALTEHRQAATVMGYYRSGELADSAVARLLDDDGGERPPSTP